MTIINRLVSRSHKIGTAIRFRELKAAMLEFEIKNLGKVGRGHVKLAPLTIFVGKNNTGKSYAATSVWCLSNLSPILNTKDARTKRPKWFTEFSEFTASENDRELVITSEKLGEVASYLNELFRRSAPAFFSKVFAYEGFRDAYLNVICSEFKPFAIRVSTVSEKARIGHEFDERVVQFVAEGGAKLFEAVFPSFLWKESSIATDIIFGHIVQLAIQGEVDFIPQRSTYIPAARTGLMLALGSLASDSLGSKENSSSRELPLPFQQFLREMVRPNFSDRPSQKNKLSAWLDDNVIGGAIEAQRRQGTPDYKYKPRGSDVELPLYATSSMITELAPFCVALRSDVRGRHLILEEPEAHLHLEAQREMARAIGRMVSSGAQVTLTTHSDTFMQQINNLISLYKHPQQTKLLKRFGYNKADLIDPLKIAVYEFIASDDGTEIHKLECTPAGFVVKSLNDTLVALAKETVEIRENQ
ncbi:AAA family ATPase [Rhodoblastus acidophilus]|uniref:AAA family ATPase n=1 Tax=Rhodoblastus acidophilus TaxID=1074 RepID=A0A6N8DHJ7_RHOAC|nr:AAA family ATPase [Rhodoblastus acidophilus]MCW2272697.1 putative ATPase [Rhodoblastus acidophilus]MTV29608.1 AAA family ATPase [Rhodoblastus acidophilus]